DDPQAVWPDILLQIGEPLHGRVQPLALRALNSREALVVEDFQVEDTLQLTKETTPPHAPHTGVRASLIVPILYQDKTAGIIHLHSMTPRRFDQTTKELCEALASQAGVVLGNVYRYQERVRQSELLSRRVETLHRLLALSPGESTQALHDRLRNIACAVQESTQFARVAVHYPDPDSGELLCLSGDESRENTLNTGDDPECSWESYQTLAQPEYALGQAYFVPAEMDSARAVSSRQVSNSREYLWQAGDVLFIPLLDADGKPLGVLRLDEPRDHLRPAPQDLDEVMVFCQQAAYAIGNHQRIQSLLRRDRQIQDDLERAQMAVHTAHSHLPLLMHKDLEQTIAVQRLSQRAARIRAGMDISEIVNRQGDRSSVLMVFGRELLTRMDIDSALIVEPGSHGPHLLHSLGRVPGNIQIEALLGQRNPLLYTLQSGSQILVSRLEADSEWSTSPLLNALDAKSFLCIPVFLGTRLDAAVLAVSQKPQAAFTPEDEQLFALLASNVAITLQNLNLLLEISQHLAEVNLLLDFNRQLGNLEPDRILQTLVESSLHVLPSAQASLVTLWDAKKGLLVPQASAGYANPEKIMQVEYKPGEALPGKAFTQNQPIRLDEVNFPSVYNLSSEKLLSYHDATDGLLPISSMAVPLQKAPGTDPL
ncbi:MAG: GAF domain-containing protein, partial [Anaerolineales bacterium]